MKSRLTQIMRKYYMLLPVFFILPLTGGNVAHSLGAEGIVFAVTLLLFISSLIGIIIKKLKLPITVILVLLGIAIGSLSHLDFIKDNGNNWFCKILLEVGGLKLSPEVILFVFLPTLVFEAAFGMDVKKLIQNIFPILVMAIPILLISTFTIGFVLHFVVNMDLKYAILFGGLISATDPVAVIALFKELGAPKRLTILMEGESLFNDATAIVLFKIILVGVILQSTSDSGSKVNNDAIDIILNFLKVFLGGITCGLLLGFGFAKIIQKVQNNAMIETVLTTVLAYLSFIIAEHYLELSGVMSTVCAGVVMGSYGRTKISPKVNHFLHEYWEFMAYISNSLIFILVGLALTSAVFQMSAHSIPDISVNPIIIVLITFTAVILARAIGIYSIIPSLHKLKLSERINPKYTFIMFWGGLRGAIALALALMLLYNQSVPNKGYANLIFVMTSMVVLLTLLVNASLIKPIIKKLKLDQLSPSDLFLKNRTIQNVHRQLRKKTSILKNEGLFSEKVLKLVDGFFAEQVNTLIDNNVIITEEEEKSVLLQLCLRLEKSFLWQTFHEKRISEHVYRKLIFHLEEEEEAIVHGYQFYERKKLLDIDDPNKITQTIIESIRKMDIFNNHIKRQNVIRIRDTFRIVRAKFITTKFVLSNFLTDEMSKVYTENVFKEVKKNYEIRYDEAVKTLELLQNTFPEYVDKIQSLLAIAIQLNQEEKILEEYEELGVISDKIKNIFLEQIEARMAEITNEPVTELLPDPLKLIEKIPFFAPLSEEERQNVAKHLKTESYPKGATIFKKGEKGRSMYIIARGNIKISIKNKTIAELSKGSFFGELALIMDTPRTATATTTLPSVLLEVTRNDLQLLLDSRQEIKDIILNTGKSRFKNIKNEVD